MVKKELDVFLSSDQKEFAKLRGSLAKKLCKMPFLACTPLENRGADPTDVVEASLRAVEKSDIYVGIFGHEYSETVIKEYKKAVECRLPCFTYVRIARRRDTQLSKFIDDILKNQFHYYEFRHSAELERQLGSDLRRFILETILLGLEERAKKKEETKDLMAKKEKARHETMEDKNPMRGAIASLKRGNDLEALVMTSIALETNLRKALEKRGVSVRTTMSFGELIREAENLQILNKEDIESLRKISYFRNVAVHWGDTPNRQSMTWILNASKVMLDRLKIQEKRQSNQEIAAGPKEKLVMSDIAAILEGMKKSYQFGVSLKLGGIMLFPDVVIPNKNKPCYVLEILARPSYDILNKLSLKYLNIEEALKEAGIKTVLVSDFKDREDLLRIAEAYFDFAIDLKGLDKLKEIIKD